MFDPRVGMEIYDNVWYLRHRLEPEEAADILAGMGVTFVLAQSRRSSPCRTPQSRAR